MQLNHLCIYSNPTEIMCCPAECSTSSTTVSCIATSKDLSSHVLHFLGCLPLDRIQDHVSFVATRDHIPAVWTHFQRLHLIVYRLYTRPISLIDEIDHPHCVILLDQVYIGR